MSQSDLPLKATSARVSSDRASSTRTDGVGEKEEEAEYLLSGPQIQGQQRQRQERRTNLPSWPQIGLLAWAIIATVIALVLAVLSKAQQQDPPLSSSPSASAAATPKQRPPPPQWPSDDEYGPKKPKGKRNLVFMVSDGMGPTSLHMTRSYRQWAEGLPIDDVLVLDQHHIGTSRTRSSSSLVTDSAAGATAFSCGDKSYNGAISVLPDHSPCGTVLEAAALAGYKTGLVVTTRLSDATPACFASHVTLRDYEDRIAEQEIGLHPLGRVTDLLLGGGRCHFLPKSIPGSCRGDDVDLVAEAVNNQGFHIVNDRVGFDSLQKGNNVQLPLLGLFADTDIPYEIDRRNQSDVYPSLEEMSRTALKALSEATKDSEQGFFLMIEGSRIDHAGHSNDPAAQVHEVIAYDKAFAAVAEFLENDPVQSALVATSDHETGGLAAARQLHKNYPEYAWFPGVLARANHSAEHVAKQLHNHQLRGGSESSRRQYIVKDLLEEGLGITDAVSWEVDALVKGSLPIEYMFADIISRRAQTGWTTHGHSGKWIHTHSSN